MTGTRKEYGALKKDRHFYWKLFYSTFLLSGFTFGGGFVIVPLMRKKFVEEYGWLEEQEMLNITAISQSSPGAIAVNASILVGYQLAGVPGAAITIVATVLPPLIIISVISLFYMAFRANPVVNAVMHGMQAGVAAVIADVVLRMGREVVNERRLSSVLVMVGAFLAVYALDVNIILVILVCGALGVFFTMRRDKHREERT